MNFVDYLNHSDSIANSYSAFWLKVQSCGDFANFVCLEIQKLEHYYPHSN